MAGYTEAVADTEVKRDGAGMPGCRDSRGAASRKRKAGAATIAGITIKVMFPGKVQQVSLKEILIIVNAGRIHVKVLERISLIFNASILQQNHL